MTILTRWNRSRLRECIRGYRILKQSGRLDFIAKIKNELAEKSLGIDSKFFSSSIFGAASGNEELVVRQYLLARVGGLNFNAALLKSIASPEKFFFYPMPMQWRTTLESYGLRPNHWRCEITWKFYIFFAFMYGILQIWIVLFDSLKSCFTYALPKEKYIYFVALDKHNLPQINNNETNHDIISWYINWKKHDTHFSSIRHSVSNEKDRILNGISILEQRKPIPPLPEIKSAFKYFTWGLMASFNCLLSILRGQWWNPLLLNQAAIRAQVVCLPNDLLAREYFFHNGVWVYRPLWTYELEAKHSRSTLYFYSTNCESFKSAIGYKYPLYGYKSMNWCNYLVWDNFQAEFVRRVTNFTSNITEVGPIWFGSNGKSLQLEEGSYIGLFDVTPFRISRYCLLGDQSEFYTPSVTNDFIQDVISIANASSYRLLWKRKRQIGRAAHPSYRYAGKQIENNSSVILVDPDMSAIRVIENCSAVISMPFTSTALIARSLGIPSAYYDPSGIIQRDDRAAHGIKILIGRSELESWLKEISN